VRSIFNFQFIQPKLYYHKFSHGVNQLQQLSSKSAFMLHQKSILHKVEV